MSGVPFTDRRRTQALRAELARMAPWLTPQWAAFGQEGDFGAALYEIAARLAEHSTRRLDQTALRDKLAFLDTLDIAAPSPRSATVPIVFVLAEKRGEPVYAPARVQIAAAGDAEPVIFETREGIAISPARLLRLIAADPGADRIELAPENVIAPPQPALPPVTYRLVSAAEPRGTMLQLAQAVGLAAGDLLRIAGTTYRIAETSGEIVTLLDPLETPAPAGSAIEKVARLDSFGLRNLSEHLAFVGHKELLKLDGSAEITLRLDPPSLVRRLTQLDIAYDLWGKPKGDDAADWQELCPLGGRDGELRLRKDWPGAVEETEVAGRKSRWIRLRLLTGVADAAPPDTRVAAVAIKVNSSVPAAALPDEGSRSIVSAFHNGMPLPLTTAFLPFGPEPQRFDTFAIAAPEALTKKGAAVELAVALSDASLRSLAATVNAPERIYGVARNGRLQAIRFDATGTARWRQLDRPPPASSGGSAGVSPRLDSCASLYAFQSPPGTPSQDIVFARDRSKALWIAALRAEGQDWPVAKWTQLPAPGDDPPDSFCLVFTAVESPPIVTPKPDTFPVEWVSTPGPPLPPAARLLAANSDGLHIQGFDAAGAALGWQSLPPSTAGVAPKPPLHLAPVIGGDGLIVAIDKTGAVWRGRIAGGTVDWAQLATDRTADAAVQPAAVLQDGVLHAIVAGGPAAPIVTLREGDGPLVPPAWEQAQAGKPISFTALAAPKGTGFPLVAVLGAGGILIWSGEQQAAALPLPTEGDASKFSLLLAPFGSAGALRLLLGSTDERFLHAELDSGVRTIAYAPFDLIHLPSATPPPWWLIDREAAPRALTGTPLRFAKTYVLPVAPGLLRPKDDYWLLSSLAAPARTGKRVAKKPRGLRLDPADKATKADDFLEMDGSLFKVASKEKTVVTLDRDVPTGSLKYATYRKGASARFGKPDEGTLLNFGAAALPEDLATLEFAGPADPPAQNITFASTPPAGETWVKLHAGWSTAPADTQASFAVAPVPEAWTQVPLPRSSENPDLAWEYFDGRGWRRLDRDFSDGTANLASSGSVRFAVPDDLSPTDVAGKQDYWIRARLVGGDYGRPSYVVDTSVEDRQSISVDRSTLNPPEIFTIEASYELLTYAPPQLVLTVNNLAPVDQTQAAAAAGAEFDLFEGLAAHTGDAAGLGRAIYLGLSRAPGVGSLSLFVDAADVGAPPLRLQAEVLRPQGWTPIVCDDETAGLGRPGLLRLFLSAAPAHLPLFGCAAWWVRLRPMAPPVQEWAPIVRGLHLNAVEAEQAKSLRQEILGSSLGAPDQSYALAETPVLPETLELRVRESLSDDEKAALASTDPKAVVSYPDIEGEWVRWCATDSFVDRGGGARLFRLDPSSGEIRFGDGRNGKIPPAGRDAIRAVAYQAGGGSRGNVSAFKVDQLKTALESVELAVNPVDAGGGADAPPQERLAKTAPARLRHANRALTPPDLEALATGSSPDVVRARCLRGRGCAIDLVVAIRKTGERCPIPSRARREGIARNVAAAGWGALAPEAIRVRPPNYVHIRVEALVIARSADGVAQVEKDVRVAIVDFLHPMEGGPGGLGWPFGRRPWPSDVQRVAAAVSGVDRIVEVVIAARDAGTDLDRLGADAIVCAEEEDIDLVVQPPRSAR